MLPRWIRSQVAAVQRAVVATEARLRQTRAVGVDRAAMEAAKKVVRNSMIWYGMVSHGMAWYDIV